MKRAPDNDGPPVDPVLAQLDALINGPAAPPPAKAVRTQEPPLVPQDPVLSQLDALINPGGGGGAAAAPPPPVHFATPVALVLPPPQPPALPEPEPVRRGPPGIFSEFGGVKAWMARLERADAHDA